ncbi:MAG TPA: Wzz/FepE/Etk N-terminal domain-containing protein [Gammaproteobacteria bacterium]|jgi:polysaccharide chain length determinant protein (PEP-CTERM system associated)|nr:Wzz/FepE/Etk N-terminal domain-containing protein [Gammaproteobacteria bacterium]
MQVQQPTQNDSPLGTLGRLWKRRRWIAIAVFVLTFAAAASFISALPDIYSAQATVLVNPQALAQDTTGPAQGGSDSKLDSVSEQVMSRDRLLKMITKFDLYPELRRSGSDEALLTQMRQDIHLERKSGQQQWGQDPTFAFTLSYQGWDPQTVAKVTNALATSYVDENNRMRASQSSATLKALEAQMSDVKKKLDAQEAKINAFRSAHMADLPEQQTANLAMLQQLSTQLHENNEAMGQALQRPISGSPADSYDADLPQLEQQLASLRTRYTDAYPDVIQLKAQIAALKRQQAAQGSTAKTQTQQDSIDDDVNSFRAEDGRLRQQIAEYQARLENAPLRTQQLAALMQGYGETRDVYSSLLKRYEETPLPGGVAGQYRVLETAVPPTDASGPGRLKLLLVSLMLCLGLTAGVVFLMEQFDLSFHSVEELRAYTRLPVLANIPLIVTPADVWRGRLRFGFAVASVVVALILFTQFSSFLGHGNQDLVWMLSRHRAQ